MNESAPSAHYEIQIEEQLDERWVQWFEGWEIARSETGATILRGQVADQPALYGVLGQLRDLGLTLISVQRK